MSDRLKDFRGVQLEDLNELLPDGYSVEELSANEKIILDFFLSALDQVDSEHELIPGEEKNATILEKIVSEIAEEVLFEVRQNITMRAKDIAIELIDSKDV